MNQLLFNPFIRIAGMRSLIIGWSAMLLSSVVGYFSHCHFDGALDAHLGNAAPLGVFIIESFAAWLCASVVFYTAGIIVARSRVRFVDIAGTMAFSRWPLLIVSLTGFVPIERPKSQFELPPSFLLLSLVILPFGIWVIALMYNAYATCTGAKGNKRIISFIAALVVAEVLSKALFQLLIAPMIDK